MTMERQKVIEAIRARAAELAETTPIAELAKVKAYRNFEVCALLDEIDRLKDALWDIGVPNTLLSRYREQLPTCTKEHLIDIILKDMKRASDAWYYPFPNRAASAEGEDSVK